MAKLPPNKQEQAYHLARKMAEQDRQSYPSSRLAAKAADKIRRALPFPADQLNDHPEFTPDWLKLTTLWNFSVCDPRFGFHYPGAADKRAPYLGAVCRL